MLADFAHAYMKAGLHVLALRGKRPNPVYHEEWSYENSFHGEITTEAEYDAFGEAFHKHGTTGIAILIPPNILVADVDTEEAAALFIKKGGMSDTPVAKTKNGLHVWFHHPGADASVWIGNRTLLFKGLGGYVVAPPSKHFDDAGVEDGVYTWLVPLIHEEGHLGPIDYLPKPLEDSIIRASALNQKGDGDVPDRWSFGVTFKPGGGFVLSKEYNLEGLKRAITEAPDGNQNNIIAWAALTAQEEGVPYEVCMDALLTAAIEGGHPKERARTTIRGVYKRRARE